MSRKVLQGQKNTAWAHGHLGLRLVAGLLVRILLFGGLQARLQRASALTVA